MFLEENHGKGSLLKSSAARGWTDTCEQVNMGVVTKKSFILDKIIFPDAIFSVHSDPVKHLVLPCRS